MRRCLFEALLVLALLALASCQTPGVQLLEEKVGQSLARLRDSTDPRPYLAAEARRLGQLRETATRLMPGGARDRQRLRSAVDHIRELTFDDTAPAAQRALDTTRSLMTDEVDRARDLVAAHAVWRRLLSPWRARQRLDRAVGNIPALLDLTGQPMPSPTDRERQTSAFPPPHRRASWLERVLHRIRL